MSGGWPVTGNDVTMNAGGRGILYRNGVGGMLDGNSIINGSLLMAQKVSLLKH